MIPMQLRSAKLCGCVDASATRPDVSRIIVQQQKSRIACSAATASSSSTPSSQSTTTTQDYLEWARNAGISFPKVTQALFDDGLRGMKALEPISPDEFFVSVPRGAALVVEPKGRCPCPHFVSSDYWKQAPWFVKMAVLLLCEAQKGRESPVWGYISQLPQASIDTPVFWSAEDLKELQYARLQADIAAQKDTWRTYYDEFRASSLGLDGSGIDFDRFMWALEIVRSRAFSGPYAGAPFGERLRLGTAVAAVGTAYVLWAHLPLQQALNGALAASVFNLLYDFILSNRLKWYALCPIIDAVNHRSTVESKIEFEYFQDTFVASTSAAYVPGEQVMISYGAHSNDILLQYYGFVEAGNPNDSYTLEAQINGQNTKLVVGARGALTPESYSAARDAFHGMESTTGRLSREEEIRMQEAILAALEAELKEKATSIMDDERQLATAHLMSSRAKVATAFRLEKKLVLRRGVARLEKRLGKLKGE